MIAMIHILWYSAISLLSQETEGKTVNCSEKVVYALEWKGMVEIERQIEPISRSRTFLACTFCFPISDHVMPSWEFSFRFFVNDAYICTCIRRHVKETILSSSITWSEMVKQNIQAKEEYWSGYSFVETIGFWLFLCLWKFSLHNMYKSRNAFVP